MDRKRQAELEKILENQIRTLTEEIKWRKRELRAEKSKFPTARDNDGASDGIVESTQEEIIIISLLRVSDELRKAEDALLCLKRGEYGNCSECGDPIAEKRLRALPFAVRCRDCQEVSEVAEQKRRRHLSRGGSVLFDGSDYY